MAPAAPPRRDDALQATRGSFEPCPGLETPPRVRCCGKSYSYYCPVCYRSLAPPGVKIPDVTLPLSVAVMLKDGRQRSTAMHAPVLAPRDVRVYEHPDYAGLPEFDVESCVVAFPSEDAVPWTALDGLARVRTLILVDSPWQQAQKALALPQLAGLRRVKIDKPPAQPQFWRVAAHDSAGHLSTIEALALLLKEHAAATGSIFDSDRLLFFFSLMRSRILEYHDRKEERREREGLAPGRTPFDPERRDRFRRRFIQKERTAAPGKLRYGKPLAAASGEAEGEAQAEPDPT